MEKSLISVITLCVVLGLWSSPSNSQAYPIKPIRFVAPFPPGGGADFLARILAQEMAGTLGQQVVIDNRAGAQGNIGTAIVAKAPPDGYTIVLTILGILAMNPWIYQNVGFDPVKDI